MERADKRGSVAPPLEHGDTDAPTGATVIDWFAGEWHGHLRGAPSSVRFDLEGETVSGLLHSDGQLYRVQGVVRDGAVYARATSALTGAAVDVCVTSSGSRLWLSVTEPGRPCSHRRVHLALFTRVARVGDEPRR